SLVVGPSRGIRARRIATTAWRRRRVPAAGATAAAWLGRLGQIFGRGMVDSHCLAGTAAVGPLPLHIGPGWRCRLGPRGQQHLISVSLLLAEPSIGPQGLGIE